jgi:hypothetical protein
MRNVVDSEMRNMWQDEKTRRRQSWLPHQDQSSTDRIGRGRGQEKREVETRAELYDDSVDNVGMMLMSAVVTRQE